MTKKLLLVMSMVLVIGCVFLLSSTGVSQGKRQLTVAHFWGGTEKALFDKILARFEELHPDIKVVELATSASTAAYRSWITTQFAAGTPPDVFLSAWPSQIKELAEAGVLLPLDDLWKKYGWGKYYTPIWKDLYTFGGHPYGVVFIASGWSMIWYTISQFKELGLAPPRTWEEFLRVCDKFKAAGIPPIITGGKDAWPLEGWFENILLRVGGPNLYMKLARHEIPWTHPKVVETLQIWKGLIDKGYFAPNSLGYGWWDAFLKRTKGEAGMQLMGGWTNASTKAEFGWTPGIDFTYFVFPIIEPDISSNWIAVTENTFSIAKGAKNTKDAEAFLNFIVSPEAGAMWAEIGRVSPSRLVPLYLYDANARKEAEDFIVNGIVPSIDNVIPSELLTEYRAQLQKFMSDPTKLYDVLGALEAKAEEIYK